MPLDHLLVPVQDLCRQLPGVEEIAEGSVGKPVWKVRGKIFVMQHGHQGAPSLWIKAEAGLQEALIASDPTVWFRPPYVGHRGWVGIWLTDTTPWAEALDLVEDGWRMTAGRALIQQWETRSTEGDR